MRAIQIIIEEHRVIETMVDALQVAAADYAAGAPARILMRILDFFETYADASHHEKEEQILFPALERHTVRPNATFLGALAAQHESCRGLLREMRAHLAGPTGDFRARRMFALTANEYASMLRLHIGMEDQLLRDLMSTQMLPVEEDDALVAAMSEADGRTFSAMGKSVYEVSAATWREHRAV